MRGIERRREGERTGEKRRGNERGERRLEERRGEERETGEDYIMTLGNILEQFDGGTSMFQPCFNHSAITLEHKQTY